MKKCYNNNSQSFITYFRNKIYLIEEKKYIITVYYDDITGIYILLFII